MKKLIIAAFAAVLGLAANAATYNWNAYNTWFSDGNGHLAGTVYVFDGTRYTVDAIVADLTGSLDKALGSKALYLGSFNLTGTDLTANDSNQASMFVIVLNDAGDGYWASNVLTTPITNGTQARFDFGVNISITFSNIPEPTSNVPEPTSGLLLVLGMAGLALRRKRA